MARLTLLLRQIRKVGTRVRPTSASIANVSDDDAYGAEIEQLLRPPRTCTRDEALDRDCPIPAAAGVYAWFFAEAPVDVPLEFCHSTAEGYLLYVGISPKAPSRDGLRQSRQNLRTRVRYHYRGNAAGSTLRLTLGSLLAGQLGIGLRRVGSGQRLTFSDGEAALSAWMGKHASVAWVETPMPWTLESALIDRLNLPLNLDQNKHSDFHERLTAARAQQRAEARRLPVLRN